MNIKSVRFWPWSWRKREPDPPDIEQRIDKLIMDLRALARERQS